MKDNRPLTHAGCDELLKDQYGADYAAVLLPRLDGWHGLKGSAIKKRCRIRRYWHKPGEQRPWTSFKELAAGDSWEECLAMLLLSLNGK